ncbi:serine hydrolase [Populibacterium corticicola]|uniref:Serine hydrolase n=1 Tax=Populibacterium corticicola TaxID=1812826 RepID=A0ABW5XFG2_9MICO
MPARSLTALTVLLSLLLVGCGGPAAQPSSESPTSQETTEAPSPVSIPDTHAGQKVQWIIDMLESEADATADQWEAELDPTFLAEVSAQDVTDLVNTNLRPARPFTVTNYQGTDNEATATLQGTLGEPFAVSVSLGPDQKITGLWFGPPTNIEFQEPTSIDELSERLQNLPGEVSALILKDGETVLDIDASTPAPLASIFKLYVLLAVGQSVESGALTWDEELALTDELRSLPSGELQDEPAGTRVTIRDATRKMISISDNTATDLLIDRLGRESVEQAVADSGHHDPAALRPFPSTGELFTLGWGDPEYRERWNSGDEAERRAVLDLIAGEPIAVEASAITGDPVWGDGIDWFASAKDVAAVHQTLQALDSAEIQQILAANPGIELGQWSYGGFKGGSSLGVLTGSWLLKDSDSSATVVLLYRGDDTEAVSGQLQEFFGLAQAAIGLVR